MYKVKVNKRGIYSKFSSAFCALIGITTLAFLVFCQSTIVDIKDIVFWVYVCAFPIFYFIISSIGNFVYRSEKLNVIRVFLLNDFVLYLMLILMGFFVVIPLRDYISGEYVVLGVITAFSYLLSLFVYLKLLIA